MTTLKRLWLEIVFILLAIIGFAIILLTKDSFETTTVSAIEMKQYQDLIIEQQLKIQELENKCQ